MKLFSKNSRSRTLYEHEDHSIYGSKANFIFLGICFVAFILCAFPDICVAASATVEGQLDKVGQLANGKMKTIGISTASIGGAIYAIVKGNLKLCGIIIAIGIVVSLYLEWVSGGMVLMNSANTRVSTIRLA